MTWEIKSDYEHQLFYRKVLDELEGRYMKLRAEWLNTDYKSPAVVELTRRYERSLRNYRKVKNRYERERFYRGWRH